MEEISKQFNIDKSLGNEFFYEQTGVDEELFESTVLIKQREIELEKNKEGNLIQKITNIVGTGEDNISYKKAIKKLEKKQLDEIGTSRSREKPINILERKIQELQNKKSNLENYENKKYEMEEQKEFYLEKINKVEKEAEFLKQEEKIELELQLEKEKIKLKQELLEKNNKKIKELESDKINIEKNKDNEKRLENQKDNKKKIKKSKIVLIMVISLVLMSIAEIMLIKNTFLNILLPIVILVEVFLYLILRKREKNWKKQEDKVKDIKNENLENSEKIDLSLLDLETKIKILKENNNTLKNEIEKMTIKIKENTDKKRNNLEQKFKNIEVIHNNSEEAIKELNNIKVQLHSIEVDKQNIEKNLEELAQIEEQLNLKNDQYKQLEDKSKSIDIAKIALEKAYMKMRNEVTPQFTKRLSENISKITDNKYKNIKYNDKDGLIVELENGNYVSPYKLSIGTIEQLYLSLRLSMIDDLSKQKMIIILDEAFAYYDSERLRNILIYLAKEAEKRQIIIFTCTNREKEILEKEKYKINFIKL